MGYLNDYSYDLYVSYAGRDDTSFGRKIGWISAFIDDLRVAIETYLGQPVEVFADREVSPSACSTWPENLEAIRNAAILLVIASPAYCESEWTWRELQAFTAAQPDFGRLFLTELLPLGKGRNYPPEFDQHLRFELWQYLPGQYDAAMPLSPDSEQYHARILTLAHQIQSQLLAMRVRSRHEWLRDEPVESSVPQRGEGPPKPRIFLSYSSKDRDRIRPLAERLEQAGLDLWWDPHIEIGTSFRKVIANQLEKADFILVAWSCHSIESEWVCDEAEFGKRKGILIPVLIDRVEPPMGFRSYQTPDISGWVEAGEDGAIEPLLRRLAGLRPAGSNV